MELNNNKPRPNSMEGFVVPKHHKEYHVPEKDQAHKEPDPEVVEEIEDSKTDKIIDDILLNESNSLMSAEDKAYENIEKPKKKKKSKFTRIVLNKWNFVILFVMVAIVFSIPFTRYKILGMFLSNILSVQVVDSDTTNGISGVDVTIDSKKYQSDSKGLISAKLHLGKHKLSFSKPYYKSQEVSVFVGFSKPPISKVNLIATGRPVNVLVENKLDKSPIANAKITILGTDYLTDTSGKVRMMLPTTNESYVAMVSAQKYNNYTATIVQSVNNTENLIDLVPVGIIYYLQQNSGKISLVSSNLDASNLKVIVSGTGKEDPNNTQLFKSADLAHMVLFTNRNSTTNQLYYLSDKNNNLFVIDKGDDFITPLGWINNNYFYLTESRSLTPNSNGYAQIKEFNPSNNTVSVIDSSRQQTSDTNTTDYAYQTFSNIVVLGGQLLYSVVWNVAGNLDSSNLSDQIRGFTPGATKFQNFYNFNVQDSESLSIKQYASKSAYIGVKSIQSNKTFYYNFVNGAVLPINIDQNTFSKNYPKFTMSPDQSQSLWSDSTGMYLGFNSSTTSNKLNFSGYSFYSWLDNADLLLVKNSNLYVGSIKTGKTFMVGAVLNQ